jgi:hypothetical protein
MPLRAINAQADAALARAAEILAATTNFSRRLPTRPSPLVETEDEDEHGHGRTAAEFVRLPRRWRGAWRAMRSKPPILPHVWIRRG